MYVEPYTQQHTDTYNVQRTLNRNCTISCDKCIPFQLIVVLLGRLFFLCSNIYVYGGPAPGCEERMENGKVKVHHESEKLKIRDTKNNTTRIPSLLLLLFVILYVLVEVCLSFSRDPFHLALFLSLCVYAFAYVFVYILNESIQHR